MLIQFWPNTFVLYEFYLDSFTVETIQMRLLSEDKKKTYLWVFYRTFSNKDERNTQQIRV